MQIGVNIPLADLQRASPQKLAAWIMLRQLQNPDAEVRDQLESFLLDKSKYANMDGDEFDSKFGRTEELAAAVLQEFFKDFKTSPQNLARKLLEESQAQPATSPQAFVVSTKGLQPPLSAHNVNLFRSKYVNFFQDIDILSSHLIRVSRRVFEESLRYEGLVLLLHDPKRDVYHMVRISDYYEGEGDEIYGNIPGMSSAVHVRGFVHVPQANFVEFRGGAGEAGTSDGIQTELDFLPGIVVGQKLPINNLVVNKIIVADEPVLFAGIHTGEVPYQVIERCAQCKASLADGKFECTGCDSISYCGEECAEAHWNDWHAFICGNGWDDLPKEVALKIILDMYNPNKIEKSLKRILRARLVEPRVNNALKQLPYEFANYFPVEMDGRDQDAIAKFVKILKLDKFREDYFLVVAGTKYFSSEGMGGRTENFDENNVAELLSKFRPRAFFLRDEWYDEFNDAITANRVEFVRAFLEENADIRQDTEKLSTDIGFAIARGYLEMVRLLLEYGARLDKTDAFDEMGSAQLAVASGSVDMLNLVLSSGADVHFNNEKALEDAVHENLKGMVRVLLKRGAFPEEEVLLTAVRSVAIDALEELLNSRFVFDISQAKAKAYEMKDGENMSRIIALLQGYKRMPTLRSMIGYSLKPDEGVRAITYGTVDFNPNYAFIRLSSLEAEELVALARKYVEIKGLIGWNIRAPYAWTEYENSGPHVTIEMSKELVKGEGVQVVLQRLDHFTTQTSRWVILHVRLPPKFKCPYGCHLSIGQERLKQ